VLHEQQHAARGRLRRHARVATWVAAARRRLLLLQHHLLLPVREQVHLLLLQLDVLQLPVHHHLLLLR
jgi:hypothetical protein